MGTGQSKSAPDEQMRMKMENGFDETEDDIEEVLGLSERDRNIRSKSNISFHTSERLQNADGDEYFNQIYNKRAEKSLSSLNSGGSASFGVKSAPPGTKKEKDPEVAAAIAELEETFKVLGDSGIPPVEGAIEETGKMSPLGHPDEVVSGSNSNSESLSLEDDPPSSPTRTDSTHELCNSYESGIDSQSDSSPCPLQYDRNLITRAGESSHGVIIDQNGFARKPNKFLDLNNRAIGTSGGYSNITYSSSGSNTTIGSRGSDQRGLLISSHAIKNARNASNVNQSVLMQQRKDFQRQQAADASSRKATAESESAVVQQENWTYEPPKIDGFDISKFKELNSKGTSSTVVPIILRDDEDKGYYSRSPEIPAYTKDELDLIAALERDVY